jgi:heme-degrading monooxygenase HmoA
MHAVLLNTTIDPGRADEALSGLAADVVPRVKGAPGVVAAYWMRSDDREHGTSVIVFESEEAARVAAEMAKNMPQDEMVHLDSIEVREVVAQL